MILTQNALMFAQTVVLSINIVLDNLFNLLEVTLLEQGG